MTRLAFGSFGFLPACCDLGLYPDSASALYSCTSQPGCELTLACLLTLPLPDVSIPCCPTVNYPLACILAWLLPADQVSPWVISGDPWSFDSCNQQLMLPATLALVLWEKPPLYLDLYQVCNNFLYAEWTAVTTENTGKMSLHLFKTPCNFT